MTFCGLEVCGDDLPDFFHDMLFKICRQNPLIFTVC